MVMKYKDNTSGSESQRVAVVANAHNTDSDVEDYEGWLIDFDYGGKCGEVTYPNGYNVALVDGQRPGQKKNPITIMDDWISLIDLIFHTHLLVRRHEVEPTIEQRASNDKMREDLMLYCSKKVKSVAPSDYNYPALLLRKYIKLISEVYDLEPTNNFRSNMMICGLWTSTASATGTSHASHAATGSPPKA
jgi:hypothetical protein